MEKLGQKFDFSKQPKNRRNLKKCMAFLLNRKAFCIPVENIIIS